MCFIDLVGKIPTIKKSSGNRNLLVCNLVYPYPEIVFYVLILSMQFFILIVKISSSINSQSMYVCVGIGKVY